jgi:hypothetical protein
MKHYQSTNGSQARGGGLRAPLDQGPDPQLSPESAQADPADSKAPVPERVPVKLNRNFLNFPLARDTRAKADWVQESKTGRWMADLPGEGRDSHRIRLILRAKAARNGGTVRALWTRMYCFNCWPKLNGRMQLLESNLPRYPFSCAACGSKSVTESASVLRRALRTGVSSP